MFSANIGFSGIQYSNRSRHGWTSQFHSSIRNWLLYVDRRNQFFAGIHGNQIYVNETYTSSSRVLIVPILADFITRSPAMIDQKISSEVESKSNEVTRNKNVVLIYFRKYSKIILKVYLHWAIATSLSDGFLGNSVFCCR